MNLQLKKIDMSSILDDSVVVLIGKRNTGKSYLTKDLLYYHRDVPVVTVISPTEQANKFYSNIDPITAIEDLIKLSKPDKNEKIIFVWPEGILPGISQEKLVDYKWLFENHFNENHLLVLGINSKSVQRDTVKYFNSLSVYDHSLNSVSYTHLTLPTKA